MIKLFVTGDIHIGKKYDRYPEIKDRLVQSRFDCLQKCVEKAERENCDFFVITGDLFDNVSTIRQRDVKEVVRILSEFGGRVLVLPGNHDYYTGEEKVWRDFSNVAAETENNIILFREFRKLTLDVGDETVSFYPAFCQSKHSAGNNLAWLESEDMEGDDFYVGLAHGAIAGLAPDMEEKYFLMTEKKLNEIPVDVWLIGHTHIPYPADISDEKELRGYKIFNPGTPEQTDLGNNTSGMCFLITLDHTAGGTVASARSWQSGAVRYFDLSLRVQGDLQSSIQSAVRDLPEKSVIRLTLSGAVPEEEYTDRQRIYREMLGGL